MTFNIHSLLHLGESVRRSGPLWGTSAFPFENGIFYDKLNVNGPKSVSLQMSRKRLKKIRLRSKINASTTSNECANYCHKLFEPEEKLRNCVELPNNIRLIGEKLKTSQVEEAMKNYLQNQNIEIHIFSKCIYQQKIFHSTSYARANKTNDTFVFLQSRQIIEIYYFIQARFEMEGRTSQSTTNDKTEELNDTSKDDPLMHCLSDSTPEELISAGNNASIINSHKSTLSQLNIASNGSLNVNNDNCAVFDSLTAPKKSSSKRKRKNSDSKENKKKTKKLKLQKRIRRRRKRMTMIQ
ncbi:hypothetical protein KQX54_008436 [Cotesia glomerata]|uniref:Uncharacterized protein n=1 Tax=Cotesia glomerata TaxID=32391 RepID=A0AAV7ITF3_COTGL|nr:hypothetical protein KQX54_008436 [Cotesia glomerata]